MALDQAYKKICVLGFGESGKALVKALLALKDEEGFEEIHLYPGSCPLKDRELVERLTKEGLSCFEECQEIQGHYDLAIVSPGISPFTDFYKSAKEHSDEIIGEIEFAYRISINPWLAITGTNGKTTTTSLIEHILQNAHRGAHAVGNIGPASVTKALELRQEGNSEDYLVAEVSSFQLFGCKHFKPKVAILLNITPDHVEWHQSLTHYINSKKKVFQNLDDESLGIINLDDENSHAIERELMLANKKLAFVSTKSSYDEGALYHISTLENSAWYEQGSLYIKQGNSIKELIACDELQIQGEHNYFNAMCAALCASYLGISLSEIQEALKTFKALEHRIEFVNRIDGVSFYNDSKATNVDAVLKALTAFPKKEIVLLVGGHDKKTDLAEFSYKAVRACKAVVCFGEAQERFLEALTQANRQEQDVSLAKAKNLKEALEVGKSLASSGDVVLLSPACSSFDEFSGYEERGRKFKEYVSEIAKISG